VDDADPALLRHRYSGARLGHGVHRCSDYRHLENDFGGESRADVYVAREDVGRPRDEQNVVKSEPFFDPVP
jgi:hypothetical protein